MEQLTARELTKKIVGAIRKEARDKFNCEEGAIRLLFAPKNARSICFLGAVDTNCGIEMVFNLSNKPIQIEETIYELYHDLAATAISGCTRAMMKGCGYRSRDLPEILTCDGRSNRSGCVAYDVHIREPRGIDSSRPDELYFRVYVSVFGSQLSEEDDERCALVAGKVLQEWCNTELEEDGFRHYTKYLSVIGPDLEWM